MYIRLLISAVLVVLYGAFRSLYTPHARALVMARLAPLQVGPEHIQYGLSRSMTIADFVSAFTTLLLIATLVFIWWAYYLSQSEPHMNRGKIDKFLMWVLVLSGATYSGGQTAVSELATTKDHEPCMK